MTELAQEVGAAPWQCVAAIGENVQVDLGHTRLFGELQQGNLVRNMAVDTAVAK